MALPYDKLKIFCGTKAKYLYITRIFLSPRWLLHPIIINTREKSVWIKFHPFEQVVKLVKISPGEISYMYCMINISCMHAVLIAPYDYYR